MPPASTPMLDVALARRIRLLGLDVDGILTENDVFIGAIDGQRVELKRFDIQDGLGIALLRGSEIEVAWITGRVSESTLIRAKELKITSVLTVPAHSKVPAVEGLLAEKGIDWSQMAFVGDDIADIPVLERVGLPIAVANARPEVKAVCQVITAATGGHGAVREVIDLLLHARGEWDASLTRFFAQARAGVPT
jgi:3-deoxy-D-manno-octulosonate 8-phosphate phosphatase (KDO 8-P phosphatase)